MSADPAHPSPEPPAPVLVGANPIVRLFAGGEVTAFASAWVVEWSPYGSGTALVLWHGGRVRLLGSDPRLASWLECDFTRHFPEAAGLPWPEPVCEQVPVAVECDLAAGLRVAAGDVVVTAADPLQRRTYATDSFDLGGVRHGLSLVLAPVRTGAITVAGAALPGEVTVEGPPERPTSSAFLTAAEVWSR